MRHAYALLPVITLVVALCGAPCTAQARTAPSKGRAKSVASVPLSQPKLCVSDAEHLQANQRAASTITEGLTYLSIDWGRPHLIRGGRKFSLGYWGQNAPALFSETEESISEARNFFHYQTASQILFISGLALVVGDLIYIGKGDISRGKERAVVYGLLGGSLATGITGLILADIASAHLSRALIAHNEGLVGRILGPDTQASLYLAPTTQGIHVGAVMRF